MGSTRLAIFQKIYLLKKKDKTKAIFILFNNKVEPVKRLNNLTISDIVELVIKTISNLTAIFHLEELKDYISNLDDFDNQDIEVLEKFYKRLLSCEK